MKYMSSTSFLNPFIKTVAFLDPLQLRHYKRGICFSSFFLRREIRRRRKKSNIAERSISDICIIGTSFRVRIKEDLYLENGCQQVRDDLRLLFVISLSHKQIPVVALRAVRIKRLTSILFTIDWHSVRITRRLTMV
ncbi:hypothetical protein CHS0354_024419 [Potamilus streckersoni]|uniref:Uncharacterized protein n=1 Tax=Potamilus streckersoni TaxID=2493646 RepID=A0AAE0SVS0_9BIVA|nr:hypothetical protein CHS0354_024419 [Potamilus streckersoni]